MLVKNWAMTTGMMWLDASKSPLNEKVQTAARYYNHKYGNAPELCLVNSQIIEEEIDVGPIRVIPSRTVLPHHFWLGLAST